MVAVFGAENPMVPDEVDAKTRGFSDGVLYNGFMLEPCRGSIDEEYTDIAHMDSRQRISLIHDGESVFETHQEAVFSGQGSCGVPSDCFCTSKVNASVYRHCAVGYLYGSLEGEYVIVINRGIESEVQSGSTKTLRLKNSGPF